MGERVTVGIIGPALHGALVAGATTEHGRLDHRLPRAARAVALAAREILLGLAVELLFAAHRAEVIGLTLVARLRCRLRGLDGHLADGINRHRGPSFRDAGRHRLVMPAASASSADYW